MPFPGTSQARGHPRAEGVPGRCVVDCALERRRLDAELNCIGAPLGWHRTPGEAVLHERLYCARGEMENRIKDQQLRLFVDRDC